MKYSSAKEAEKKKQNRKNKLIPIAAITAALAMAALLAVALSSRQDIPILMYHSISASEEDAGGMVISASQFEEDIDWLCDSGYVGVLPRDLAAGKALPDRAVIISFDDGYEDNYTLAYPVLKRKGMCAEISVIVSLIDDESRTLFASWDQLKEMQDSGIIEIGSHSYNLHNPESSGEIVDGGPNGVQRRTDEGDWTFSQRVLDDIRLSKILLEENLGTGICCFAYPYGATDPDADELIEELFPVSFVTSKHLLRKSRGLHKLTRYEMSTEKRPWDVLD